ncbi:restriction endonuclease subunit S [Enterobacteriaceae bacterium G50]|nr:restriction endonuclease subunit S [Enterobacteriaceae bacterium G50]
MAGLNKYQAYPEYRDSGVSNIGVIPTHWKLTKLKYLTKCLDGSRIPLNATQRGEMQGAIPYWGANNIVDYVNTYLFDEELILLGEDGSPFFDKNKDVAFHITGKIWPNNHVHVLRPMLDLINARFLAYAINCTDFCLHISGSTRDKLNQSDMDNINIRYCDIYEQDRISFFLDHETAKIDNLIKKQQQLIELLKEKRQAVISHAVTKGLNPDVPMKDSGVEWLGEIPEKWEIWKLSHAYEVIGSGTTPTSNNDKLYCGNIAWVTTGELRENIIYDTIKKIDTKTIESFPSLRLYPSGSVIIAMYGATIGRLGILGISATTNQACCVMTKSSVINNQYLFYWLQAFRSEIIQLSSGGGQPNINQEKVSSLKISAPSGDIQIQIVNYINSKIIQFDTLIDKQLQQIELLKERRTALISATVTGKIDLRNWTAPIPKAETPTEASA